MKRLLSLVSIVLLTMNLQCQTGRKASHGTSMAKSHNAQAASNLSTPEDQAQAIIAASQTVLESPDCTHPSSSSAQSVCQLAGEIANPDLAQTIVTQGTQTSPDGSSNIANVTQIVSPTSGNKAQGDLAMQVAGVALLVTGALIVTGASVRTFVTSYRARQQGKAPAPTPTQATATAPGRPKTPSPRPPEPETVVEKEAKWKSVMDILGEKYTVGYNDSHGQARISLQALLDKPNGPKLMDLFMEGLKGALSKNEIQVSGYDKEGGNGFRVGISKILAEKRGDLTQAFAKIDMVATAKEVAPPTPPARPSKPAPMTRPGHEEPPQPERPARTRYSNRANIGAMVSGILVMGAGGTMFGLGSSGLALADTQNSAITDYILELGAVAQAMTP